MDNKRGEQIAHNYAQTFVKLGCSIFLSTVPGGQIPAYVMYASAVSDYAKAVTDTIIEVCE